MRSRYKNIQDISSYIIMIIITLRYHRLSGSLNIIFICLYMITIFGGSRNNRFVLARVEYIGLHTVQYKNALYMLHLKYTGQQCTNDEECALYTHCLQYNTVQNMST